MTIFRETGNILRCKECNRVILSTTSRFGVSADKAVKQHWNEKHHDKAVMFALDQNMHVMAEWE